MCEVTFKIQFHLCSSNILIGNYDFHSVGRHYRIATIKFARKLTWNWRAVWGVCDWLVDLRLHHDVSGVRDFFNLNCSSYSVFFAAS